MLLCVQTQRYQNWQPQCDNATPRHHCTRLLLAKKKFVDITLNSHDDSFIVLLNTHSNIFMSILLLSSKLVILVSLSMNVDTEA